MTATLSDYTAKMPSSQRQLFDRLHGLVVAEHPEAVLVLSYKMPTYKVGRRKLFLGAWRDGLSIYGSHPDSDGGFSGRHPELLSGQATIHLRPQDAAAISDDELRGLIRAVLKA